MECFYESSRFAAKILKCFSYLVNIVKTFLHISWLSEGFSTWNTWSFVFLHELPWYWFSDVLIECNIWPLIIIFLFHKGKMKVTRNEKRKKLHGFLFIIFEAFLLKLKLNANHLFWSCVLVLLYALVGKLFFRYELLILHDFRLFPS